MKELLLACDRCGSKLDEANDYVDILIALHHKWEKMDLCKKCFDDLCEMTDYIYMALIIAINLHQPQMLLELNTQNG